MVLEKTVDEVANTKECCTIEGEANECCNSDSCPKRGFSTFLWESRSKFIFKLDWWVLSYICLTEFIKYLDEANIKNAYVSGMETHFHMKDNEYNLLTTWWTIGYIVGHLPTTFLVTRSRIRYWLPAFQFLWGSLVMSMAGAKNINTLYAIRFFIGLLQAPAFAGSMLLFADWYTPSELAKRSLIYEASSPAAKMFSGYIQAGLYKGMNGRNGLESWQWLFIFDGVIGLPLAIYGYFALPDTPSQTKAFWITPEEKQFAIERMEKINRKPYTGELNFALVKRVAKSPYTYLFTLIYTCHFIAARLPEFFNLYLKSTGRYTVYQLNTIPTIGNAIEFVTNLLVAWLSDYYGHRWIFISFCSFMAVVGSIILVIWPAHNIHAMYAGWLLMFIEHSGAPIVVVWLNELLGHDGERKVLTLVVGEIIAYVFRAWVPLLLYPSGNAPYYGVGYPISLALFALEGFTAFAMYMYSKYEIKRRAPEDCYCGQVPSDASVGSKESDVHEAEEEISTISV
ncbi:putative pantothenate transporter [Scheffersomyces amazonensis]|uniref:putative pantothenate transporter n=1 Tax=Scheffersomyces amazonensis TaxID=1078765 RepID=UPI00315DDEF5